MCAKSQKESCFCPNSCLFQHCHLCFLPNPSVHVTQTGTMVTVRACCEVCHEEEIWNSEPYLLGKFRAGNLLLSFSILRAGASIKKILLVFKHMGVLVYHKPTFYHQRHLLIPSVVGFWKKYQQKWLGNLKNTEVVLAGDGHHDSMGDSAKYCTYTIFCCTAGLILHIAILQVL